MGQLVSVIERPSSHPGMVRFEANRNLTGMGHEHFRTLDDAIGPRPAASLARMLIGTGHVDAVHIFGNIITVDVAKGFTAAGLSDIVRDMYQYWKPGMEPPSFEDLQPADAPAEAGAAPVAGGAAPSAYESLVPAILRDRSAAALAKWKASH